MTNKERLAYWLGTKMSDPAFIDTIFDSLVEDGLGEGNDRYRSDQYCTKKPCACCDADTGKDDDYIDASEDIDDIVIKVMAAYQKKYGPLAEDDEDTDALYTATDLLDAFVDGFDAGYDVGYDMASANTYDANVEGDCGQRYPIAKKSQQHTKGPHKGPHKGRSKGHSNGANYYWNPKTQVSELVVDDALQDAVQHLLEVLDTAKIQRSGSSNKH